MELNHILKLKFIVGHPRSVKAAKNIIASLFIKGMSIVVGFMLVPITLHYLDQSRYGIWVTLSSFLSWFTFFEIGLGNGLRNKLAEALAVKDYELGKIYVSTTYVLLAVIITIVAALFFVSNQFIDWTVVLNTSKQNAQELSYLALVVFGFFFLRFVLNLIIKILYADQRPAVGNLLGPIGNLISLVAIYILTLSTQSSLLYLGIILSSVPVLILFTASIYFFLTDYRKITPSIKYFRKEHVKDLFGLGIKFFFIQISALVLFQSTNIIIIQFFDASHVTIYNIAYKYFSTINMLFTIIIAPYWSAYTEAWVNKDIKWIKNSIKKLLSIWALISIGGIVMLLVSNDFYRIWVGSQIHIPFKLSLALLLYFITFTFGGVYNMFINGIGKIKLQTISLIIGAVLFIPISYFLVKNLGWGMNAIVFTTIAVNFYSLILAPIQYYKIMNGTDNGIWGK